MHAVPHRHEFYLRIGQGATKERVDGELVKWVRGLKGVVCHMRRYFEERGYNI
jgi:hypothetical protein